MKLDHDWKDNWQTFLRFVILSLAYDIFVFPSNNNLDAMKMYESQEGLESVSGLILAGDYTFKVNYKNTRTKCKYVQS